MQEYTLIAVKIEDRVSEAAEVQKVLTDFGCAIKIRLGLHDVPSDSCSPAGLVILQVVAKESEVNEFLGKLNALDSVSAKSLVI